MNIPQKRRAASAIIANYRLRPPTENQWFEIDESLARTEPALKAFVRNLLPPLPGVKKR